MRKDIFLAVPAAGILFFGAGAVLLALTDPALPHWEIAFWIGVICTPLGLVNLIILLVWEFSDHARRAMRPIVGPTILINFATCALVAGLVWHFSETGALKTIFPGPLAGLTNVQLRERIIAFAHELRDFDEAWDKEDRAFSEAEFAKRSRARREGQSAEQQQKDWDESTQRLLDRNNRFRTEFMHKFRPEAVILRDELKARLGPELPYPQNESMIGKAMPSLARGIFEGHIITPTEVHYGPEILEYWASRLP